MQHCALENLPVQSLINAEVGYSNNEREALGMLHGLEKFHHYYSACEVNVMTDQKHWW